MYKEITKQMRDEAIGKYKKYADEDPFPEIEPSLLNSADITDYVETMGLIYPFYEENLKPASYGIKLKGEYIYWKNRETRVSGKLEDLTDRDDDGDQVFTLLKNSIAFVQLEPTFQFPSYIAARFNLKIKHIYQGLLLGTGPLVDPGYCGNIYIPLHNLTNNDYKIKIDKSLIWMEFTKLSSNKIWNNSYHPAESRTGQYVPFEKIKLAAKKTLSNFINDAYPNSPILSTIPNIIDENDRKMTAFDAKIEENTRSIKETTDNANKATSQFNRAILISIVAVAFSLITSLAVTIWQTIAIHNKTIDYIREYDKKFQDVYINEMLQTDELKKVKAENDSLKKQLRKRNEKD